MAGPTKNDKTISRHLSANTDLNIEPLVSLSAEGYALAFHRNPDPMVITSLETGQYIDVNEAWIKESGYSRHESIGHTSLELGLWVSTKERDSVMKQLAENGSIRETEVRFQIKSGIIKNYLFSADILALADENYLLSISKDITPLKQINRALQLSEERYYKTFHSNPAPMSLITLPEAQYVDVNEAFLEATGFTREELMGHSALELGIWASQQEFDYWIEHLRKNNYIMRGEDIRFRMKNGEVRSYIFSTEVIDMGGRPHMLWCVQDITARKMMEEALRRSEDKFSRAFDLSPFPMVITTLAEGRFVNVNEALCQLVGYTRAELLTMTSLDVGLWDGKPSSRKSVQNLIALKQSVRDMDLYFRRKDGEERICVLSAEPIVIDGEDCLLGIVQDITERRRAENEIRFLSTYDRLTGLLNRSSFEDRLKHLDAEKQKPVSIIIGDINGLKIVNDALGHENGDRLLKTVADILLKVCRTSDIIARWGGDEFIVLLPNCANEAASQIMEQIRSACNEERNLPVETSVSLGLATLANDCQSIKEVITEAENKMYRRKLLENKSARSAFIISLERTLWTRSHETREHCQRLQEMALTIGRGINLPNSELDNLKLLAALHDIGKIAIPNNILEKPGALSQEEWETIRKHPEIGYRIAVSTPEMAPIAEAILHHHERWDGGGYPLGFKGEEIPLLSRIIAIADAYDVMVNGRPYQTAVDARKAWEEIVRCSGSQFDPVLVERTIQLFS